MGTTTEQKLYPTIDLLLLTSSYNQLSTKQVKSDEKGLLQKITVKHVRRLPGFLLLGSIFDWVRALSCENGIATFASVFGDVEQYRGKDKLHIDVFFQFFEKVNSIVPFAVVRIFDKFDFSLDIVDFDFIF